MFSEFARHNSYIHQLTGNILARRNNIRLFNTNKQPKENSLTEIHFLNYRKWIF